jgi:hypothetical protein
MSATASVSFVLNNVMDVITENTFLLNLRLKNFTLSVKKQLQLVKLIKIKSEGGFWKS